MSVHNYGTNIYGTGVPQAAPGSGGSGGLVLLEQHTASASVSLDFTSCISSTYDDYMIEVINIIPATDNAALWFRFSSNGGSTWNTTANHFQGATYSTNSGGPSNNNTNNSDKIILVLNIGNAYEGTSGYIRLSGPASALPKSISWNLEFQSNSAIGHMTGGGKTSTTTAVNAFQFLMSSGNIASGTIRVYGLEK